MFDSAFIRFETICLNCFNVIIKSGHILEFSQFKTTSADLYVTLQLK